jgi:hypothetical protein
MKFDQFDQYSEDLLMAQYDVSEIITHELMKGEVREDFLIATLESCTDPKPKLVKGTISDGHKDAGQLDIILCRPHAHIRSMGGQCYVEKNDALCVIEVKGNCTGEDLKKAQRKAEVIQSLQGDNIPQYGLICYKVALQEQTILNRFGFSYYADTLTYVDLATIPNEEESNWKSIMYPGLDFFVSLQESKKLFLRRYEVEPGTFRFVRSVQSPLIRELFKMTRSLWIPAYKNAVP